MCESISILVPTQLELIECSMRGKHHGNPEGGNGGYHPDNRSLSHPTINQATSAPDSKYWFTTSFLWKKSAGKRCSECGHRFPALPSIAFRHLLPNSARFGYATEAALFISAQLSTDAVSALRKFWVVI